LARWRTRGSPRRGGPPGRAFECAEFPFRPTCLLGRDKNKFETRCLIGKSNSRQKLECQYSFAPLSSPEALHPGDDIDRRTASIRYNRPFGRGNWASLLVWGRNKNQPGGLIWNGYLAESTLRFADANYIWAALRTWIGPVSFWHGMLLNGPIQQKSLRVVFRHSRSGVTVTLT